MNFILALLLKVKIHKKFLNENKTKTSKSLKNNIVYKTSCNDCNKPNKYVDI